MVYSNNFISLLPLFETGCFQTHSSLGSSLSAEFISLSHHTKFNELIFLPVRSPNRQSVQLGAEALHLETAQLQERSITSLKTFF